MADSSLARAFVLSHILEPELDRLSSAGGEVLLVADHKSRLQELLRASGRPEPRYEMVGEEGPAHRKSFTMQVIVLNAGNETEFSADGSGNSKKAASQLAAQKALERLQGATMDDPVISRAGEARPDGIKAASVRHANRYRRTQSA